MSKHTESAAQLVEQAERSLLELSLEAQQAGWVYATYITDESESLASRSDARLIRSTLEFAQRAAALPPSADGESVARRLKLLRLSLSLATPSDPALSDELTRTVAAMVSVYGKGRYRPKGRPEELDLQALDRLLGESRDPALLEDAWTGWHEVAVPLRPKFERYVDLANRGAKELGFGDTGEMWRSKYDMGAEEFEREANRLWMQVRPLYESLHAYVRRKLAEQCGPGAVSERGPIPAHLLGNMWAQSWDGLFPIVAPTGATSGYDLDRVLKAKGFSPIELVKIAERFFTSLGLPPLPESFWSRSMFVRPRDREVICHASAWDLDSVDDLRIKMCIEGSADDFRTVHHELGHNFYQRAYNQREFLFRDGAHDGFHEAIGDTIALSITPEYLVQIGLRDAAPGPEEDLPFLLRSALEKIAFLPFGLLIDQWRWKVFDGTVTPENYNRTWWEHKLRYQGVRPPSERPETKFDPGAKFHVASNVPYMRYFLAHILQFQFHRALAKVVGWNGPLHRCSIYGNRDAGERLGAMLEMGQSRPWPEALAALTGERTMDGSAILEYYAPLAKWLDEQNRGHPVGW